MNFIRRIAAAAFGPRSRNTTLLQISVPRKSAPPAISVNCRLSSSPMIQPRKLPSSLARKFARTRLSICKCKENSVSCPTRGCLLIAVGSRHYIQDARPDLALKSLESSSKVQAPRSQSIVYATESAESFQMNAPNSKAHLVHNVHESPYIRLCDF